MVVELSGGLANAEAERITVEVIDAVLNAHWPSGPELLQAYRNHLLRMTSFCRALTHSIDPF